MTRRIVIGKRANGEMGVFVAPEGLDAYTAADSQLTLNISTKIYQLLKLGFVTSSQVVPLGFGQRPYVLITGEPTMSGVPGYGTLDGPARPSPLGVYGASNASSFADIASDASYMYVTCGSKVSYAVYNVPF